MGELTDLLPIIILALVLWLGALTYFFYRLHAHYKKIAKKAHEGDLVAAIEALLKKEEENTKGLQKLRSEVLAVAKQQKLPIQKVGLVRFNPFNETGGDHSFSLCLLDGESDGFIITALHTRDRTRFYAKTVVKGESKYELAAEEKKALKEAEKHL